MRNFRLSSFLLFVNIMSSMSEHMTTVFHRSGEKTPPCRQPLATIPLVVLFTVSCIALYLSMLFIHSASIWLTPYLTIARFMLVHTHTHTHSDIRHVSH